MSGKKRVVCVGCGTGDLVTPVVCLCAICETPEPEFRCFACFDAHAASGQHVGVRLSSKPSWRRAS